MNTLSRSYGHTGKLGDFIFGLAAVRVAGGGGIVLGRGREGCDMEMLRRLVDAQGYVWNEEPPAAFDLDEWRRHLGGGATILSAHAKALGVSVDVNEPWLRVESENKVADVVLSVTNKNGAISFDWNRQIEENLCGRSLVFLGTPSEASNFSWVRHEETEDLYDVARIVSGADEVWCSESSVHAIAEGLGKRVVLVRGGWTTDSGRRRTSRVV